MMANFTFVIHINNTMVLEYFKMKMKGLKPKRDALEANLELWKKLVHKAVHGVSINQILDRFPNLTLTTDSSKQALGGFWSNGIAFRLIIEGTWLAELDINVLELLAIIIGIKELSQKMNINGLALGVLGENTSSIP